MFEILLAVQIVVTVAMIVTVLLQQNANDGLGGLGGGMQPSVSVDSSGALSKITAWLAAIFMLNSLLMASMTTRRTGSEDKLLQQISKDARLPAEGQKAAAPAKDAKDAKDGKEAAPAKEDKGGKEGETKEAAPESKQAPKEPAPASDTKDESHKDASKEGAAAPAKDPKDPADAKDAEKPANPFAPEKKPSDSR